MRQTEEWENWSLKTLLDAIPFWSEWWFEPGYLSHLCIGNCITLSLTPGFLSLNACLSVSVHPPFNTHSLLIILYLGISILEDQDQEFFIYPVMLLLLTVFSFSFTFYLLSLVVPCYANDIFYWNAIIFLVFLTIS